MTVLFTRAGYRSTLRTSFRLLLTLLGLLASASAQRLAAAPAQRVASAADISAQTTPKPAVLDLRAAASDLPQLRALLVSWRGEIIAEHYANGVRPGALANVKSASKSIIAALVGIAIERGLIKSVREPIVTYFPELRSDPD